MKRITLRTVVKLLVFLDLRNGYLFVQPSLLNEMVDPTILGRDRNMGIKTNGSIGTIEPAELFCVPKLGLGNEEILCKDVSTRKSNNESRPEISSSRRLKFLTTRKESS